MLIFRKIHFLKDLTLFSLWSVDDDELLLNRSNSTVH